MKASAVITSIFLLSAALSANAQQNVLASDQNPRYKESQQRYMQSADSLIKTEGLTVQQTYKAYDWYQAREERRKQRREWNHQENMNNRYYNGGYYNNSWPGSGYYYNPYSFGSGLWLSPNRGRNWGYQRRYW